MPQAEPVIEKVQADISLEGALDESKPEESIDWVGALSNVENLVPLSGSYGTRPGLNIGPTTDTDSVTLSPIHRLLPLRETFGVVGKDFKLSHWSDNTQTFHNKGRLSEFSVNSIKAGAAAAPTTMAGCCGVAVTTNYIAIAYLGESNDTSNTVSWLHLDILDKSGDVIIKSYRYEGTGLQNYTMVGVDSRYLHIFQSGPGTVPRMFVIDTNSLPAGPVLSPSFTNFTSGASGNHVIGAVAISGASVACITQGTSASALARIEKFNNSATSTATASLAGDITQISGLDTDGTNFYVVGKQVAADEAAEFNFEGYWRASWNGTSPWSGTASAGGSSGRNLTETGTVAVGTAVNGFTPAFVSGSGYPTNYFSYAAGGTSTFLTSTAGTVVALFKQEDASGGTDSVFRIFEDTGTAVTLLDVSCSPNEDYGVVIGNQSFTHPATPPAAGTYFPFKANQWILLMWKWDATNSYVKINHGDWIKSTTLPTVTADIMKVNLTNSTSLLELGMDNTTWTDEECENYRTYLKTRYALSL